MGNSIKHNIEHAERSGVCNISNNGLTEVWYPESEVSYFVVTMLNYGSYILALTW